MRDSINDLFAEYVELKQQYTQYVMLGAKQTARKIAQQLSEIRRKILEKDGERSIDPTQLILPEKCLHCTLKKKEEKLECYDAHQFGGCEYSEEGGIGKVIILVLLGIVSLVSMSLLWIVSMFFNNWIEGVIGLIIWITVFVSVLRAISESEEKIMNATSGLTLH